MGLFTSDAEQDSSQRQIQSGRREAIGAERKRQAETSQGGTVTGQETAQTGITNVQQIVSSLDEETLANLRSLVPALTSQIEGGGIFGEAARGASSRNLAFAQDLQEQAGGVGESLLAAFDPIRADLERRFEQETMAEINRVAGTTTGARSGSSGIQELISRGQADLSTQMARVASELLLGGQQLELQAQGQAAQAGLQAGEEARGVDLGQSDAVANLQRLIQSLALGEQRTTGLQEQEVAGAARTETQQTLNRLVDIITGRAEEDVSEADITTTGRTTTEEGDSLLDWLRVFGSFA